MTDRNLTAAAEIAADAGSEHLAASSEIGDEAPRLCHREHHDRRQRDRRDAGQRRRASGPPRLPCSTRPPSPSRISTSAHHSRRHRRSRTSHGPPRPGIRAHVASSGYGPPTPCPARASSTDLASTALSGLRHSRSAAVHGLSTSPSSSCPIAGPLRHLRRRGAAGHSRACPTPHRGWLPGRDRREPLQDGMQERQGDHSSPFAVCNFASVE